MEKMEWRTEDKAEWPRGEWDSEPDKVQWQDETTGLPCLIVRGPSGGLCGYVGVSEGHPYFGKEYGDCRVDCHGGLTFSDFCADSDDPSKHICHIPGPGEPDRVWWLGFDCAHLYDYTPGRYAREPYKSDPRRLQPPAASIGSAREQYPDTEGQENRPSPTLGSGISPERR